VTTVPPLADTSFAKAQVTMVQPAANDQPELELHVILVAVPVYPVAQVAVRVAPFVVAPAANT
jgi:hypothetical protein